MHMHFGTGEGSLYGRGGMGYVVGSFERLERKGYDFTHRFVSFHCADTCRFCHTMVEDPSINAMTDALQLFAEVREKTSHGGA